MSGGAIEPWQRSLFGQGQSPLDHPVDHGDAYFDAFGACIAAECRSSPFLAVDITLEPHDGPIWLRMRGSGRVNAFIAAPFTTR